MQSKQSDSTFYTFHLSDYMQQISKRYYQVQSRIDELKLGFYYINEHFKGRKINVKSSTNYKKKMLNLRIVF